jgi:ABC-2 type transport system permease protein
MSALLAQTRTELVLTLRRGESLLLILGIPLVLLAFFSTVDVLPKGNFQDPIDFLLPGVIALAVMSTGMVQLAIGTAFERQYGVLKRLGITPLGRPRLLTAKTLSIVGIGLLMAGVLRGEVTLAAANGLYLLLLLVGGMVVPLSELPTVLRHVAELLPSGALVEVLVGTLNAGRSVPTHAWIVLVVWAIATPALAAKTFRWE